MYKIYALYFKTGRIYVGMTSDLFKRITDHKRQKVKSTKNRGLFKVRVIEECLNRDTARVREKYWKSGCDKEELKIWSGSSVG